MWIGGSVFFLSDRDASGEEELFVAPQDGKGEPVKVAAATNSAEPFFDPEGKYLYLLSEKAVVGICGLGGGRVDGGYTFVPEFGSYDLKSQWVMENEGVTLDIEVDNLPADELAGKDAQFERGLAPSVRVATLACSTNPRENDRHSGKSGPAPTG